MDVINQQADFGREADFKLGNKEEREAKACACSLFSRELPCSSCEQGTHTRFCSAIPGHGAKGGICTCSGASSALQGPNAGFSKLMNRLLGVHVDMQRKIFDYFTALQVAPAAELGPGR